MKSEVHENLGIAIVERPLLRILSTLWDGPVAPENLSAIEKAIRAFLISPTLIASRLSGSVWHDHEEPLRKAIYYEEPFGDHLLDYEFVHPQQPHPFSKIDGSESEFLTSLVGKELISNALSVLPSWINKKGEAFAFFDAWYEGYTYKECETSAELMWNHEDEHELINDHESLHCHALFHLGPVLQAKYYVGCHRAGLIVYGHSPLADICASHIFSQWPEYLFKALGEEFKKASDELRGPGVGVMLPPLTSLVLSRAPNRDSIPAALRNMRDEYLESRTELWEILSQMWFASNFVEQLKLLKKLRDAANLIFPMAVGQTFDALSLGISATGLIKGSVSPFLSEARNQLRPTARIAAVSFAAKLSEDFREHLLSSRDAMKRHFTKAELAEFGFS